MVLVVVMFMMIVVRNVRLCTEKKKGIIRNLKRFRELKRIRNLFKFRINKVSYDTIFYLFQKRFGSWIFIVEFPEGVSYNAA